MRCLNILVAGLFFWSISISAQVNYYVGAGVTATNFESSGLQSGLASVGLTAAEELDDTAFGGQIFAGAMFTQNFGVEFKYSDSGETDDTITIVDTSTPISVPVDVEASIDGFTLYGVATIPFPKLAEASIKLGYTFQDAEVSVGSFGIGASASDDDDGVAVAGLLRFRIGEHWAITGELEYFSIDFGGVLDEPLRFGLNGEYHF